MRKNQGMETSQLKQVIDELETEQGHAQIRRAEAESALIKQYWAGLEFGQGDALHRLYKLLRKSGQEEDSGPANSSPAAQPGS
jgi:hypothetical protein